MNILSFFKTKYVEPAQKIRYRELKFFAIFVSNFFEGLFSKLTPWLFSEVTSLSCLDLEHAKLLVVLGQKDRKDLLALSIVQGWLSPSDLENIWRKMHSTWVWEKSWTWILCVKSSWRWWTTIRERNKCAIADDSWSFPKSFSADKTIQIAQG